VSNTDLARNFPVVVKILAPVLLLFMNVSKPAQGAESSLYGALNPAVKAGDFIGPTGKGERAGAPGQVELPAKASDKALCEKLWSVSEELLDISFL
jgi:hypothetical protein